MSFPKPDIQFFPASSSLESPVFSILIPSWNNLEMLKCCIYSIRDNSAFSHQIIVHVNEGTDGSLEWVRSENLDYTFSSSNSGVCYSVNAMAKLAKSELLLYLNDDMYVCKNWDKPLKDEADSRPDHLWYLSGTMIEPTASSNPCVLSPHNFGRHPGEFLKTELDDFATRASKSDWFGSCWPPSLVHKLLFDKVGGYSEEFSPGMYSDPDFGMKLWKEGVRHFKGLGNSLVYHFQSRSTGRVKKNNGRLQFARKWGITSSFFYKEMLQMGRKFDSAKSLSLKYSLQFWMVRLKAIWISLKN